jgi:hypothetical protein
MKQHSVEKIRDTFLNNCQSVVLIMLRSYEIDDPKVVNIDEKGAKRALILDFSKLVSYILIEEVVYWR